MESVKVVLRNYKTNEFIDYNIIPEDNQLAKDWLIALENDILKTNLHLEKNFCFHGFPYTQRHLDFLCKELNKHIHTINQSNINYIIEEWFSPDVVRYGNEYSVGDWPKLGLRIKHNAMNNLHNHFEVLQGTVENPSKYTKEMSPEITYAVRQLNNICHEIETLCLSQRKLVQSPQWVRPSQITTFLKAPRHLLTEEHRKGFIDNEYSRELGGVYMHWCQIGKTLMEVFRDEGAPELTETVCEAITHLAYYSGEFDIEFGNTINRQTASWHAEEIDSFNNWLIQNGFNPKDPKLSSGYLKIGHIDLLNSFGTKDALQIWNQLGNFLDIYKIEYKNSSATYEYHWSNSDYQQIQLMSLK